MSDGSLLGTEENNGNLDGLLVGIDDGFLDNLMLG